MTNPQQGSALVNPDHQKVCFIYKEDYPWDVRVEKILDTLVDAGFKMSLICRNLKHLPCREDGGNFKIYRLPALPGLGYKLNKLLSIPFYFNPFWFFWIWRYARHIKPRVIVVRDLPLMPLAILVGRMLDTRIIFDMAECYPEMYASTLQFSDAKVRKFLLKNPSLARFMEKFSVNRADHVFVMIEESRDRLVRLGANPAKISIVSNTPAGECEEDPHRHEARDVVRLLYVGFVTRIRGVDNVLRGLRAFLDRGDPQCRVEVNVVGIGAALEDYRQLCRRLALENWVNFHGWKSQEFVDELYSRSDIGVLTYHVCSHWNHTIPNKLFDYMQAGIPVLATDVIPIKRIVEQVGCGLIFRDNDPEGFADCLTSLLDENQRSQMGARGVEAVRSRYNWKYDTTRMLQALGEISRE